MKGNMARNKRQVNVLGVKSNKPIHLTRRSRNQKQFTIKASDQPAGGWIKQLRNISLAKSQEAGKLKFASALHMFLKRLTISDFRSEEFIRQITNQKSLILVLKFLLNIVAQNASIWLITD